MERKISKFAVGDKVITSGWIKTWAIGTDEEPRAELVEQITEDDGGFKYRTTRGGYYNEDQVFPINDAKPMALKFLSERMIKISSVEEDIP